VDATRRRSPWRALLIAALSALFPGSAHLVAGRRRSAVALAIGGAAAIIALVILAITTSRSDFLRLSVRPSSLTAIAVIAVIAAATWVALVARSYQVLHPQEATGVGRVLVPAALIVLCALVAAPGLIVARYALVQRGLITDLFPDTPVGLGNDGSQRSGTAADPWGGRTRVNVLLLAGDSGPGRFGTRTDSMVVASIAVRTGDVVLISLPRNLQHVPMPAGPLRDTWPNRFPDLLNGVYEHVQEKPELLAGARDRGAEAVKLVISEILGVHVDYYAMANMEGFQRFVDALGGVTVTVKERLPIGGITASGQYVPPIGYIAPGQRRLSGYEALWYARSRRDSSDYDRMDRQRCLIGAVVQQADPVTVLRNFESLASATKKLLSTDIPRGLLPPLVDVADLVRQRGRIRSLQFVPPLISTAQPDYFFIRRTVQAAIREPSTSDGSPSSTPRASGPTRSPTSPGTRTTTRPVPVTIVDTACGLG
jgi:polyisoprenyl-teichoic acid--peptidoglycan teichoic acid transferase